MKYGLVLIAIFGFLVGCNQHVNTEINTVGYGNVKQYVSLDGLWRVTPETSIKYPHGTLEPIILICGNARGKFSARGCFLWEGHFYDYWNFNKMEFIDSTNQLIITYNDGSIYKGVIDDKKELIQGIAYWDEEDTTDANKLDFVRDEDMNIDRLFIPYPPGQDGSIRYIYRQPDNCNDQLQTASIFGFVKDSTAFYSMMEKIIKQEFGRLESFLLIKDQKLILEEYFYGYDRTQLHPVHSCTKSITSLLLGISLGRHKNLDVNVPVFSFFPQFDSLITPEKEKITLKHVLTMTSGLPEDDEFEKNDPDDLVKQMLIQPLESGPGEKFKYNGNNSNLLGSIINALEKKQADDFAREVLFNKLGISEFKWEKENGVLPCQSELQMLPRDMAKIGLLVLNNGSQNGEQIIPKEWIIESGKLHVAETEFFDYGYQWWYRSKQNTPWWKNPVHGSNDEHDMFLALGYGGQYIMIIRDLNMVLVITSSDYNEENGMSLRKIPLVIEEVVPLFDE